jgi:hypothetical protein
MMAQSLQRDSYQVMNSKSREEPGLVFECSREEEYESVKDQLENLKKHMDVEDNAANLQYLVKSNFDPLAIDV